MPPRSAFIAQVAAKALRDAKISEPPVSVRALAAYYGITLLPARGWPTGAHASWQPTLREIRFRAEDPKVRQRFSIGHELGHLLLGHDPMTFSSVVDPERDDYAEDTLATRESEADQFAGALLMPAEWLRRDWSAGLRWDALAQRYLVSRAAVGVAVLRYRLDL